MQESNIEQILPELGLSVFLDSEDVRPWKLCKHKCVSTGKSWAVMESFDTKEEALQYAENTVGFAHMLDVLDMKVDDIALALGIGKSTAYRYQQQNYQNALVIMAMRTLVRDYLISRKSTKVIRSEWSV